MSNSTKNAPAMVPRVQKIAPAMVPRAQKIAPAMVPRVQKVEMVPRVQKEEVVPQAVTKPEKVPIVLDAKAVVKSYSTVAIKAAEPVVKVRAYVPKKKSVAEVPVDLEKQTPNDFPDLPSTNIKQTMSKEYEDQLFQKAAQAAQRERQRLAEIELLEAPKREERLKAKLEKERLKQERLEKFSHKKEKSDVTASEQAATAMSLRDAIRQTIDTTTTQTDRTDQIGDLATETTDLPASKVPASKVPASKVSASKEKIQSQEPQIPKTIFEQALNAQKRKVPSQGPMCNFRVIVKN